MADSAANGAEPAIRVPQGVTNDARPLPHALPQNHPPASVSVTCQGEGREQSDTLGSCAEVQVFISIPPAHAHRREIMTPNDHQAATRRSQTLTFDIIRLNSIV